MIRSNQSLSKIQAHHSRHRVSQADSTESSMLLGSARLRLQSMPTMRQLKFGASMGQFEIRLHLIGCRIVGDVKDLRPLVGSFPELVHSSHGFCREVGRAAKAEGLDGLLATSVCRSEGTNVPVFKRACLSEPEKIDDLIFRIDAVAKTATLIS